MQALSIHLRILENILYRFHMPDVFGMEIGINRRSRLGIAIGSASHRDRKGQRTFGVPIENGWIP